MKIRIFGDMKMLYIIILLVIGFIITIIGALFKIMHWPGATLCLITGASLKVIALILFIIKLVAGKKYKDFLNS